MNTFARRAAVALTATAMAASLAACGEAGDDNSGSSGDNKTIGLLLPESKTTRYESFDYPLIKAKITELCSDCKVDYKNASENVSTQKQQFDDLIASGVKVIILDTVDSPSAKAWVTEAASKDVKVVAYDRLAEGPVSAYVSFDNEKVGKLQGQALVDALGSKAATANVVMINGKESDPNAALFKAGAHSVLDSGVGKIVYEQSGEWDPAIAGQKVGAAITSLGKDGFDAVYSANDGMAGGVIAALESAGIKNIPVGGQDAELAALQRILAGTQSFTIYKPYKPEAEKTAEIAVNLLNGKAIDSLADTTIDSPSNKAIPSSLLEPTVVTKENIKDTIIADNFYKVSEICTADYAAACKAAGIE
ncbi:sugar ABC transporter substrate-binding protein [Streptomyces sp. NBC_00038]|uniref:sugar ABC transporter substrate-binding protein n=1 Tax=Streptomyces sp. NBC_00038 TaxID=2903615 RepID=UPI00225346FE|nr:substrate-binding domain-containing protein [Streptomyces sp. NBC_00038]MCX5561457.1 substrate-binding domain-containing protein [Streptomyces sp. NBC_00038]